MAVKALGGVKKAAQAKHEREMKEKEAAAMAATAPAPAASGGLFGSIKSRWSSLGGDADSMNSALNAAVENAHVAINEYELALDAANRKRDRYWYVCLCFSHVLILVLQEC